MELFLADANIPFAVALALMLMLAMMEGILGVLGAGISQALDGLLPDMDVDIDVDTPDATTMGGVTQFLGWLRFGQIPSLILLILFLLSFGLIGITLQQASMALLGHPLPVWLAVVLSILCSTPVVRLLGGVLGHFLIRDETEVISTDDFTGHRAIITVGTASQGNPAQARFKDKFGTSHYVMIEPDGDDTFQQGDEVLLLNQQGTVFIATRLTDSLLN